MDWQLRDIVCDFTKSAQTSRPKGIIPTTNDMRDKVEI